MTKSQKIALGQFTVDFNPKISFEANLRKLGSGDMWVWEVVDNRDCEDIVKMVRELETSIRCVYGKDT